MKRIYSPLKWMALPVVAGLLLVFCACSAKAGFADAPPAIGDADYTRLRLPAVPLVTHDPYLSVWSSSNKLNTAWATHWTGAINALCALVRVDGKTYLLAGGPLPEDKGIECADQKSLRVTATRTQYIFAAGAAEITLTFTSPLLLEDVDVLSRPASYVHFSTRSTDGKPHNIQLYFDATAEWTVHNIKQTVAWETLSADGTDDILAIGTTEQKILGRKGDNVRIDWGHLLLASPKSQNATSYLGDSGAARSHFAQSGQVPASEPSQPRAANNRWPGLAFRFDLGTVADAPAGRFVVLAYDDKYSVQYFKKNLRPWWNRDGKLGRKELAALAIADHEKLARLSAQTDARIATDALNAGGRQYADLCIAVYRQAIAAHKVVVGPKGQLFFFSKENFSNGSIGTIDITYPSFPLFAAYNPKLARGLLDFIFDYVESGKWQKPFAPHDIGTYPWANGQTYRGDMPVEESANVLILTALLTRLEGNSDYVQAHRKTLDRWADYLVKHGFDPENQLCTDDFAGRLARNTNLSVKAIVGLGAYADALQRAGDTATAATYRNTAKDMAKRWPELARDGDHYSLAFEKPGTWSLKYNLVWDKVLGLGLFDSSIAKTEYAYYLKKQNAYGVPLDNRERYTKSDWILWAAVLADSQADFDALVAPVWKYVNETSSRVPISDWHWTHDGKMRSFQARAVVGGYSMKVLEAKIKK
ncbi:MAG: DUF4965 domain-containing protein [Puniceicoccales bacterium]|jgi:hypothetical protein|nr:DUF4965 domain-containing protein [Puniceicoccales bacterium]